MENIKKFFFLLSFGMFEMWVYCVFTPIADLPLLIQAFSNQYWLLFAMSFGCFSAGVIVGIYFKPVSQKISQLEYRINHEDRISVLVEGVIQTFVGVVVILMDVAIYPSRAMFLLVAIFGMLVFINGIKYFSAPFKY